LYVAAKVWSLVTRNEPLDIFPLFRPIVIFILCISFQGLVITPMHYVLSPLRTYTNGLVEKLERSSQGKVSDIVSSAQEQRKKAIEEDPDSWGITKVVSIGIENLKEWLISTILDICSFFKSAVYIIMNFIRIFCLVLLAMLGPIAFALSLIPSFENGLSGWFAKYISIYLWAPIFNIICILLGNAEVFLAERVMSVAGSTGIWGLAVLLIVVYIIGAYVFLSTPTFATWIVQGGASAMELSTLTKGAAVAGAVGGGAAGIASGKGAKIGQAAGIVAGGAAGGAIGAAVGGLRKGSSMASGMVSGAKAGTSIAQRGMSIGSSLLGGKFGSAWSKLQGKK
jgi:hypothetical protein